MNDRGVYYITKKFFIAYQFNECPAICLYIGDSNQHTNFQVTLQIGVLALAVGFMYKGNNKG